MQANGCIRAIPSPIEGSWGIFVISNKLPVIRSLATILLLICAGTANAQYGMVGFGVLRTEGGSIPRSEGNHLVYYGRIAYAFEKFPVILGLEHGKSKGIEHDYYGVQSDSYFYHWGISVGCKFTRLIGVEGQFAARIGKYYHLADGENEMEEMEPMLGIALLLFTHGVSHFTLGYGMQNTWRLGYIVQLGGYD